MALALACLLALYGLPPKASAQSSGMIRVKLTRLNNPTSLTLKLEGAYVLQSNVEMNLPAGSSVKVTADGDNLYVDYGGIVLNCGANLRLMHCSDAGLCFTSPALANVFCGDLYLTASGGVITPILRLYIEDYLYGVVGYEMSNSYPLEALKAQAVAARNYAIRKMQSRASKSYDVTDSTSDQVFKGYNASQSRVIQAVNETRGQVLYAGSELASCYYSASNGGQTESTKNAWGGSLSYSTVKDDPYDLENSSAKKTTAIIAKNAVGLKEELKEALMDGVEEQLQILGAVGGSGEILSIDSIEPMDSKYAEPSRLYRSLRFGLNIRAQSAAMGETIWSSVHVDVPTYGALEDWYGLSINTSSNETVWVEEYETSFRIIFRRWGHGIGMSQRGAQQMASAYGMSAAEVLDFYYPGTQLQTLSLSEEGAHAVLPEPAEAIARAKLSASTPMYAGRDRNGAILAQLNSGMELNVYAVDGEWIFAGLNGLAGWIPVEIITDFVLLEDPLSPVEASLCVLAADAALLELPVSTARMLVQLRMGTELTLCGQSQSWALVQCADGVKGYLPRNLLSDGMASPEPSVSPSPTATAEPTATAQPTATAEPTATAQPTATAEPTATAQPTATVEPTDTVQPTSTATVQPTATPIPWPTIGLPTPTPSPEATQWPWPTVSPTPKPTFEPQPTAVDYPMATPKPAPEGAEGMLVATGELYVYVNVSQGSSLTLRQAPSTSAAAMSYLSNGTKLQMLAFDDEWACVRTQSGKTGFAARRYLYLPGSTDEQPVVEDEPKDEVKKFKEVKTDVVFCNRRGRATASIKLYQSYSTSSKALCTIPASAEFTVYAYNRQWAYVNYSGRKGFVLLEHIRPV